MNAADTIDELRARNPAAADLAALCALALTVEPRLLRRLRLLLPRADVAAETDLWSSDLVDTASVTGLSLRRDVAERLASTLRAAQWDGVRERALAVIDTAHADLSWSARLSEQLARAAVTDAPEERTRELVLAAVGRLLDPSATERTRIGIARWLLAALARLPGALRSSEVGQVAGMAADLHLDARAPEADPTVEQRWLPYLLGTGIAQVEVGVGLRSGQLELNGIEQDGTIMVPATSPLVLDAEWSDGRSPHTHRLRFAVGERVSIPLASDRVELRTLAGTGLRLVQATNLQGFDQAGFDFTAQWAKYRPCLGLDDLLDKTVPTLLAGRSVLVTGPRGSGKSVFACELARRLVDQGVVVPAHFFGVERSWDDPGLVEASLAAQRRDHSGPVVALLDGVADTMRGSGPVVIMTGRKRNGVSTDVIVVDLQESAGSICVAMVAAVEPLLVERLEPISSVAGALVELAGSRPGRLGRLLAWILAQPAGELRLSDIPPTLTMTGFAAAMAELSVTMPDSSASDAAPAGEPSLWLAEVALAREGFTTADLARTVPRTDDDDLAALLERAQAANLLTLDGPARTPEGVWLPTSVRAALGLADAVADWFGPQLLVDARRQLALGAVDPDAGIRGASAYQITHGVATIRAAEADGLSTELRAVLGTRPSAAFLHRRAVQDGVAAAIADLELLTHHAGVPALLEAARFVAGALAPVPPEQFADFVLNEMRRRGHGEGTIGRFIDSAWPPPLAVRSTEAVPPVQAGTENIDVSAAGTGAWLADRKIEFADGRDSVVLPPDLGEVIRMADAAGVVAFAHTHPDAATPRLTVLWGSGLGGSYLLPAPVTALLVIGERAVVGCANGMIVTYQEPRLEPVGSSTRSAIDPRDAPVLLLGHGAEVTALAQRSPRELASASADGTVRIWDLPTGRTTSVLPHPAAVRQLVSAGDHLVTADDEGTVRWWRDGVALSPPFGHAAPITVLLASADGTVLSCAKDGSIVSSSIRSDGHVEANQWAGPGSAAARLAVTDGKLTITSHDDGALRWWFGGRIEGAQTLPRVVRGLFPTATPGQVLVVDEGGPRTTALAQGSIDATEETLRSIAVGNERSVAVGTARTVWSTDRPGHGGWAPSGSQGARSLAFLGAELLVAWADGSATRGGQRLGSGVLVAGSATRGAVVSERHLQMLDPYGDDIATVAGLLRPGEEPTALCASEDDGVWLGTSNGRAWCFGGPGEPGKFDFPAPITAMTARHLGSVVGMADGSFSVIYNGAPRHVARVDGQVNGLTVVGRRVLTASADRTLRLWDVEHGMELGRLAHTSAFTAVAAHPYPDRVIARTADGLVWVVDVALGEPTSPITLFESAEPLDIVNTTDESFGLAVRLRPSAPIEVRRIEIQPRGFSAPVVSLDTVGRYAEPLHPDGRLVSPRRTGSDEPLTLRAWVRAPVPPTATVRLGVVTADRADELIYAVTFSHDSPDPPTIAYLDQEEPPDARSTTAR